jgi:hypothetical protein
VLGGEPALEGLRLVHYDQATATALVNYNMYRRRHKHTSSEYLLLTERGPMSGVERPISCTGVQLTGQPYGLTWVSQ